ncbi:MULTISPECIES: hypothetical protein [Lacrimispora]|uniref:hypothetical protein n=1 Tax=Lacrimispora TaxID=2719231 RepID=UPI00044D8E9E|nr:MULTISPECIES: hypothetical protein [Lacrimispora]EXG85738.1 hypothetical protein K413DRAFT_2534 [Clostridium sp. ASBs410]MDR7810267.1 hypothetical protein [Lacrimispora sp.]SEU24617.1 hypothetical protein SAMN05443270_3835 [Lacrimispora sphenoides]
MSLLTITAYFIIPIYTILFAWGTDWFTLNFSVLGNLSSRKNLFLLWGIIIGTYFYYILKRIISGLPRNRKETVMSITALLLLVLAVITPYLPDSQPLHAVFHVILSFLASISLLICLYMIVWKLYCMNQEVYRPYLHCLLVITVLSAFLFFLTGIVSTVLEIFFILSSTFLLQRLYRRVLAPKNRWRYDRL